MSLQLGCIADDLTGATDIASVLVREGLRTALVVGVPDAAALRDVSGAAAGHRTKGRFQNRHWTLR